MLRREPLDALAMAHQGDQRQGGVGDLNTNGTAQAGTEQRHRKRSTSVVLDCVATSRERKRLDRVVPHMWGPGRFGRVWTWTSPRRD